MKQATHNCMPRRPDNSSNTQSIPRGLTLIEVALMLPLLLGILLTTGYLFNYLRTLSIAKYAAETGADIAASNQLISSSTGTDHVGWNPSGLTAPIRPKIDVIQDACRRLSDPIEISTCTATAVAEKRTMAYVWDGYTPQPGDPIFGSTRSLPFSLYEQGSTPGYEPVQVLPIIGIERACFEPFNESSSRITSLTPPRYFDRTGPGCAHVRPMYWQSPQRADFDGDRREDLVFFRPRGSGTVWGTEQGGIETDFIVLKSGANYSYAAGSLFVNLATDQTPRPIPVVADYDRDGTSDFGVFEPQTGRYRIAFSSGNYRVLGEGSLGIIDSSGTLGAIAIPGTYLRADEMMLAGILTGSDAAGSGVSARYDIYTANVTAAASALDIQNAQSTGSQLVLPSGAPYPMTHHLKPHAGTVSVPAFSDYDDDGITEIGFLSWYGGHLSKHVGGKTVSAQQPGLTAATLPYFESSDAPPIAGAALSGPLNVRMNPFDMSFDNNGNMYYLDSIDHRLWKISADSTGQGSFVNSTVSAVMPDHAALAKRPDPAALTPDIIFPSENVWNLPNNDTRVINDAATEANVQPARGRNLKFPRKMAIASGYDKMMYIADWGNGRIIQVQPDASGSYSPTGSNTKVVIGSKTCTTGGSCSTLFDWSGTNGTSSVTWQSSTGSGGRFRIWPTAVAIVPDPVNPLRYFLAFSTQYAVYVIVPAPARTSGGPRGENGERIHELAGRHGTAPALAVSAAGTFINFTTAADNAHNTAICPVVDLAYDDSRPKPALIAASSCSLTIQPGATPDPLRNSGGLFWIEPWATTSTTLIGRNKITKAAGGFYTAPCLTAGRCSQPTAAGAGIYQRKLDLHVAPANTDIVNPTDLAIGPRVNGKNSIYFINQWDAAPVGPDTTRYPLAPNRTDSLHENGVYLLDVSSNSIMPITNPYLMGSATVPVQSTDWYSPYFAGGSSASGIRSHTAPARNAPVPASAALAISPNKKLLYTSFPPRANPAAYATHPYYREPKKLGFIHKIELDFDLDGVGDFTDTDIDGDLILNSAETAPRSPLCPQITGSSGGSCRTQEKTGLPRLYATKLSRSDIITGSQPGGPTGRDYLEFALFNSVSECSSGCVAGDRSRPEPWAALLNFGDDQDSEGTNSVCISASADMLSPYYQCSESANGPIAAPQALHAFVGDAAAVSGPSSIISSQPSYRGSGFLNSAVPDPGAPDAPDQLLFHFPAILSSTRPRENGIKTTRRIPIDQSKSPGPRKSGVLGWDYQAEKYSFSGTASAIPAFNCPFRLSIDSSQLNNYSYSGFALTTDSRVDNDSLNYMVTCAGTAAPTLADGRRPAIDAVVLQLDHDDTSAKENPNACSSTSIMDGAPHWPCPVVAGGPAAENSRLFLMIDHDGDGARNPTWLASDAVTASPRGLSAGGAYVLAASGLRNLQQQDDPVSRIDGARAPALLSNTISTAGASLLNQIGMRGFLRAGTVSLAGAPRINGGFDYGRYYFDTATMTHNHENVLMLALDFEGFIVPKARVSEMTGPESSGAALYANYVKSNRFKRDNANQEPPGIRLAQQALSAGLSGVQFVTDQAQLGPGKAYVAFVKSDGSVCDAYLGTGTVPCDGVKVAVGTSFFGTDITVESTAPLPQAQMAKHLEECDPNAPASLPCN